MDNRWPWLLLDIPCEPIDEGVPQAVLRLRPGEAGKGPGSLVSSFICNDGEAVAIDAESGAPAFFEALFPVAGVRHGSAGGVPGSPAAERAALRPRPALGRVPSPAAPRAVPADPPRALSGARRLQARGPQSHLML